MSARERLHGAAVARLARGDGKGALRDLGIDRSQVLRDAGVGTGSLYQHFDRGAGVVRGLADTVMSVMLQERKRLGEQIAVAFHRDQAVARSSGIGRPFFARAITELEKHYGAVPNADEITRARERAYYLAVAMCDAYSDESQAPLSSSGNARRDLRFQRHLREASSDHQRAIADICESLLSETKRVPLQDLRTLQMVIGTLFEGAMLRQRVAAGGGSTARSKRGDPIVALEGDALVDAILHVFQALTRRADRAGPGPDAGLFGGGHDSVLHEPLWLDREAMLATVIEAIDELDTEDTLTLCALHRSEVGRARADDPQVVKAALMRFLVARGGHVRTLEKIGSSQELKDKVSVLRAHVDRKHRITSRVLVMDAPPAMSPMLVGDRVAFLGREVDGLIVDAVAFFDELGRRWCRDHCDVLWHDDRGYTLATPNGLNHRGIESARRRLESLEATIA